MSHALLAIQNILQNSNIFILSRETVLFKPFGKKKVTQFSGFPPISVSYLKPGLLELNRNALVTLRYRNGQNYSGILRVSSIARWEGR